MRMRWIIGIIVLSLLITPRARAQTSNSLPFTAVTPPPAPTLTSLGGLSPTGRIYTGMVMPINGTGFTSSCVVNVDGTAQPGTSYAFSSATLINFTIPASLGSVAGAAHTITVSCPQPALTLNSPVTLPNAKVGVAYTSNLNQQAQVQGGLPPLTYSLSTGTLPTGLTLSSSGVVSGTPSGVGSFNFTYTVKDNSLTATPHSATLTWVASIDPVSGYNVYRGDISKGPTRSSTLRPLGR